MTIKERIEQKHAEHVDLMREQQKLWEACQKAENHYRPHYLNPWSDSFSKVNKLEKEIA